MSVKNLPYWLRIIIFYVCCISSGIAFSIFAQQEEVVAAYNTACNWVFEHVLQSNKRYYTTKQLRELSAKNAPVYNSSQARELADPPATVISPDPSTEKAKIVAEALASSYSNSNLWHAAMRESLIAEGKLSRDMSAQEERYDALVEYNYRIRMGSASDDQSQDISPVDEGEEPSTKGAFVLDSEDLDPKIYNEKTINK